MNEKNIKTSLIVAVVSCAIFALCALALACAGTYAYFTSLQTVAIGETTIKVTGEGGKGESNAVSAAVAATAYGFDDTFKFTVDDKDSSKLTLPTFTVKNTGNVAASYKLQLALGDACKNVPVSFSVDDDPDDALTFSNGVAVVASGELTANESKTINLSATIGELTETLNLSGLSIILTAKQGEASDYPSVITTAADLSNALKNAQDGATIDVTGCIDFTTLDNSNGEYNILKNVTIDGHGTTTLKGFARIRNDRSDCNISNVTFKNITFDTSDLPSSASNVGAINSAANVGNLTIDNCNFIDAAHKAIVLTDLYKGDSNVKITNCSFVATDSTAQDVIYLHMGNSTSDKMIAEISNNVFYGTPTRYYVNITNASDLSKIYFGKNTIKDSVTDLTGKICVNYNTNSETYKAKFIANEITSLSS